MAARLAWLRATPRRVWWTSFGLLFAISLVWTFTTPPLGSGDETAHVVRAHALADGDLTGSERPGEQAQNRFVEVPAIYVYVGRANLCFAYDPRVPASCSRFDGPQRSVEASTVAGRYPPAYYAVVGLGSKPLDPLARADLMRVISAAMCAALVASAVVSLRRLRRRAIATTGLAIALTPSALYMFGVVNPSALETAAGIGVWVSGALLFAPRSERAPAHEPPDETGDEPDGTEDEPDGRLVVRTGIAAIALVLSRPASPFWLLVIGLSLLALSDRDRVQQLVADRRVRIWSAVVLGATIAQTAWILIVKPLDQHFPQFGVQGGLGNAFQAAIGETYPNYVEMIGSLGFMNEPVPTGVIVLWTAAIGALVTLAWVLARRAAGWVIAGLVAFLLVVPTVIQAIQAEDTGLYWQGRFVLPLAVGIPIIAAIELARRPLPPGVLRDPLQRLVPLVALVFLVGQGASYAQQLRRWTVGSRGTLLFFVDWDWARAAPPWFLLGAFVLLAIALTAWWFVPDRAERANRPVETAGARR